MIHAPIRNGDRERDSHDGCDICAIERHGFRVDVVTAARRDWLRYTEGLEFRVKIPGGWQRMTAAGLAEFRRNLDDLGANQ